MMDYELNSTLSAQRDGYGNVLVQESDEIRQRGTLLLVMYITYALL